MKLAVLADIHANLPALQAVTADILAWQPDLVVVAGDIVNRGPRPAECLRFVQDMQRDHGWQVVRGNHEDYVIGQAQSRWPRSGPMFEAHMPSYWTYLQLGSDVTALEAMPYRHSLPDPGGGEVRIVHGSMLGVRDGIYPETTDEELAEKLAPAPALLCAAHTHRSLVRSLNGTLVVNVGSAGLPFDGDTRPAYARLHWRHGGWQAEIARVTYDFAQAERDYDETGYLEGAGPLIEICQVELRTARSLLFSWAVRYQRLVERGEISMRASVDQFLAANP